MTTPAPGAWPSYWSYATSSPVSMKRAPGIAQAGHALARGELALGMLAGDPLDAAALPQLGLERADLAGERAEPRGHASCRWRSANHSRM